MDKKQFDKLVTSLKRSGLNEDQIMGVFIKTFETKKCNQEDLEIMVSWLGYHLTDEFFEAHNTKRIYKVKKDSK